MPRGRSARSRREGAVVGSPLRWRVAGRRGRLRRGALIVGNTAEPPLPLTNRPAIVEHERKPARLSAADRRSILAVASVFVLTAVRRDHAERAWPLASAALRTGTTLADWKAGTLPFPPYPGEHRPLERRLLRRRRGRARRSASSRPIPRLRPLVHRLTLVRSTRQSGPVWLVDGWTADELGAGRLRRSSGRQIRTPTPMPRSTPSPGRFWILSRSSSCSPALVLPSRDHGQVAPRRAAHTPRGRRSPRPPD